MNNVTEKTRGMVQRWINAKNRVNALRREIGSAECELSNAQNELGKWLIPEGGKLRDLTADGPLGKESAPFNIWFGSGILRAVYKQDNNYRIDWLKEPDGKDRLEFGV